MWKWYTPNKNTYIYIYINIYIYISFLFLSPTKCHFSLFNYKISASHQEQPEGLNTLWSLFPRKLNKIEVRTGVFKCCSQVLLLVFLKGVLCSFEEETQNINIYNINEVIMQTQKYSFFQIWNNKPFSEENKVAGSATCCPLRSVCLFSLSIRIFLFWLKFLRKKLCSAPLKFDGWIIAALAENTTLSSQ